MSATSQPSLPRRVPALKARRLGLHTQHQAVVVMRTDCHVCRAEGLAARSQVLLTLGDRHIQATLFQIDGNLLGHGEVALSEAAWSLLGVTEGEQVYVSHPPSLDSLSSVRSRIHGHRLDEESLTSIVRDVVAGRYTDVHLAAFLTASSALPLDLAETAALTKAMVAAGDKLDWGRPVVMDKHSIGGLPGNRTTPIVVAIAAASGLLMPKTSSRAITSPAGTADTMETLTNVDLDIPAMRRVVEAEGGCLAWGGAVRLSPADDMFIRIERVLDIDTEGQMIASVLSKKIAAGSTHVVIDIPVGPTAKVRTEEAALGLSARLTDVAAQCGLTVICKLSDGTQPVGRGVGPALEAADVLAVLQNLPDAPNDLRERACSLAGAVLEMGGVADAGAGYQQASAVITEGRAWKKFQAICDAQGGMRKLPSAAHSQPFTASRGGRVINMDNRRIARLAKLAGAPDAKAAGLRLDVRLGQEVQRGQPLFTMFSETSGEMAYASEYLERNPEIIKLGD